MGKGQDDRNRQQKDEPRSRRAERRAAERRRAQSETKQKKEHPGSEASNRRLIVGAVIAVVIVAIGFIAFGWYQTQIKPFSKTVLRVEDTKYNLSHLQRRMQLELDTGFNFALGNSSILNLPNFVISQLEGEAALLEGIGDLDIEITDEDVAAEIRRRGGLADDVEPSVFADEVRDQVGRSGLKQNEYDLMLRGFLAEERAHGYFLFLGPTEEPQVRGRMIILADDEPDDEEKADVVLARLEAGEDFMFVALEVTLAPSAIEIDWFERDGEPTVFEDVQDFFFDAEVGERSNVISQRDFFYIIEVLEQDEARPLEDDQRERVADRELAEWISGLRDSLNIERNLSQDDGIRALNELSN